MWSLCLYGRQSRKKYLYKTFDTLPQPQCITEAQNIFSEFQTRVPWGEDLDLFLSNEDNVGCIRSPFSAPFRKSELNSQRGLV